jgi:protein-S-isoprenylcysteine O-methyltransferase Ste14
MNIKAKVFIAEVIEYPVIALALFLPAGSFAWVAGWVWLGVMFGCSTILVFWLLEHCPGLLEERMGLFMPGQKAWDKVFVVLITVLFLVWLILMPLDAVRFGWSWMPFWLQAFGLLLLLYSFYLFFLVFRENPYLSATVRVQAERGQTVVSTGPYRHVRHPMYSAALLFFIATPLLLSSWYGILVGLLYVPLLGVRAVFEERLLLTQLKGYDDYLSRVKYRFIPGIW